MERRLNVGESFLWIAGPDSFPIAVSVTMRGEISVEGFRAAIKKARQKHPLMGVRIAIDKEKHPWFVSEGVPDCPLRIIDRKSDEDAVRELKNELVKPFAWEIGPLVRFALVHSAEITDLIAVCHHCVADGIATAILIRDIISFLLNPERTVEVMPDQPPLDELIPDFVRTALPRPRKSHKPAQERFLKLTPALLDEINNRPKIHAKKGNLQFNSWELPEKTTAALLARCRQENVRVHSALCAACGLGSTFKSIMNAVNLRNRISPPIGDRFGTFAATISATLRARPRETFWDVARHYQKQFERHLKDLNMWIMFLPAIPAGFEKKRENMPEDMGQDSTTLIVSNVGDVSAYGAIALEKLQIEKIIGGGVAPQLSSPLLGFATIGGKMRFNLIYLDSYVDESVVQEITTKVMVVLKAAIGVSD